MNRSLKLSMLIALALGCTQAMALELGQVQVKSTLGQPLLAEIPLHPANPAELQNLTVRLASSEDFARAGILGGRTSIPLHFSVANSASGQQVIRITSSVAVDDPFLDLLVEVNGKAGKSVREFAILLDPPGTAMAPSAAAAVATAVASPAPTMATAATATTAAKTPAVPSPRPPRAAAATVVPTAAARPAAAGEGQYGPVERGQTLSAVARSTAPAGVDVHQMLLALKQANPDAFYRDNINALKSGVVLRVPTATQAQTMAVAAAVAEVSRQNSDWRAGTTVKPAIVADAATRSSASSAPDNTPSNAGDRLALVPAKDGHTAKTDGAGSGSKGDKAAAGLHQDLLRAQESVASLLQQSTDLKTRLKDLADIKGKSERLVSLKDSQIAELQAQLAAARKAAGTPPTTAASVNAPAVAVAAAQPEPRTAPATATSAAGTAPVATASTAPATAASVATTAPVGSASTTTAGVDQSAAIKPAAGPAHTPAPVPVGEVEQPWYMQTWAWAAGAGGVVVLLLLALLGRRRKVAEPVPKLSSPLADRFESTPSSADLDIVSGEDVDQEELLDQLAEHPDDIGLHLELATLYYSRRDVEHFEAAAEAMHAHITDPQQDEWQDVMHMGEDLVPEHPLFDHHPAMPVPGESAARHEFDIEDYPASGDAPMVVAAIPPLPPQAPKKVSEYTFDFDLTKSAASEAGQGKPVVAPVVAEHGAGSDEPVSSWQFDEQEGDHPAADQGQDLAEFNDDPIDTKLDLARAYLDMGDADGARAMLGEVLDEGSQMQQDAAQRLLETLH